LTRQLLAASRAVRAHIAVAWGQRRNRVALMRQLSAAQLEAAETQIWIEAAIGAGYLAPTVGQDLNDRYFCIVAALDQLMELASVRAKRQEERRENASLATA